MLCRLLRGGSDSWNCSHQQVRDLKTTTKSNMCFWFDSLKKHFTFTAITCLQGAEVRGWSNTRNISRRLLSAFSSFSKSQRQRRRRTGSRVRRRRRWVTRGRRGEEEGEKGRKGSIRGGGRCLGEESCSAQERNLWRSCQTWLPGQEQRFHTKLWKALKLAQFCHLGSIQAEDTGANAAQCAEGEGEGGQEGLSSSSSSSSYSSSSPSSSLSTSAATSTLSLLCH